MTVDPQFPAHPAPTLPDPVRDPRAAPPAGPPRAARMVSEADALAVLALGRMDEVESVSSALGRLTAGAKTLLGAAAVSVTANHQGHDLTFASTGPVALELDERQYELRAGPCTDALHTGRHVESVDLRYEHRWQGWTAQAVAAGVLSMRSIPITVPGVSPAGRPVVLGVLNCYGGQVDAFGPPEQAGVGYLLAAQGASLLTTVTLLASSAGLAAQLEQAMTSRATIEQAKGVLATRLDVDIDTAWSYLVRLSQDTNRKLRDVAADIVSRSGNAVAGEAPSGTAPRPGSGS